MTAPLAKDSAADESSQVSPFWWGMRIVGILGLIAIALFACFISCVSYHLQASHTLAKARHLSMSLIQCESRDGHYPAAYSTDPNGRPLLSWRVRILPYLDAKPLYQRFHLDEPWDSPHNLTLLDQMPGYFSKGTSSLPTGHTCWLAVVGPRTVIVKPQQGADGTFSTPVAHKFIRDGSSKTIFLVQVDDAAAVPWTKPADYEYDPADPGRDLRGDWSGKIPVAFADGHTNFLKSSVSDDWLNAAFTRDGGERVADEE